ncbi:ankyrin repeat-containing domain protein [Lentinula raphanica]|nr:ankyrin repeat-containing domain protein [Lentinula raphanica]
MSYRTDNPSYVDQQVRSDGMFHYAKNFVINGGVFNVDSDFLNQDSEKPEEWLVAPNCSINYASTASKRVEGTGQWILQDQAYLEWKKNTDILWIEGKGDTSIIKDLQESQDSSLVIYHYFDIRDNARAKTSYRGFLLFLLLQLGVYDHKITSVLQSLKESVHHGFTDSKLTNQEVVGMLIDIAKGFVQRATKIRIVIDALNECEDSSLVLDFIAEMASLSSVGIIISSCGQPQNCKYFTISLRKNHILNEDIATFVDGYIKKFFRSVYPTKYKDQIKQTLIEKADEGFQYIGCQLQLFQHCQNSRAVESALTQLPSDLKETYTRALEQYLRDDQAKEKQNLLLWLLYSYKPLHKSQAAIILSIDLDSLQANPYAEMLDALKTITNTILVIVDNNDMIQLAHASVREFLLESHSNVNVQALFSNTQLAHKIMGQMFSSSQKESEKPWITFHQYATQYWAEHSYYSEKDKMLLKNNIDLSQRFLSQNDKHFKTWQNEYNYVGKRAARGGKIFKNCSPLHVAAFFGLKQTMHVLLQEMKLADSETHSNILSDINMSGEILGTAAQAAASGGHQEILEQLLSAGADINAQGGYHGTALQVAAFCGHRNVIQLLLAKGAAISTQKGLHGTALHAAVSEGHKEIVQLLLESNANINSPGRHYGIALHAAVSEAHDNITELLLYHGADVTAQKRSHETALQVAVSKGHKNIVELLLKHGAVIDDHNGYYGTALYTAVTKGHKDIIQMLLDQGAKVNAQHKYHGTALHKAVSMGRKDIIRLLLKHGADVNVQGYHKTVLQEAITTGQKDIIEFLLAQGANVNF